MNKEKVKIMTHLAIYEKNIGQEDFAVNNFFKSNYVSYQNFKTRLSVAIALCIFFGIDLIQKVTKDLNKITEFDFIGIGIKYLIILAVVLTVYTIISTMIYRKRYKSAEIRIGKYKKLLGKLDQFK
ncbi:hypothetical protein HZI73_04375 [Vallitalea pronyensis]|uniref:Uncharacterized protein n=1 Tax=Vallitalea pronyensis TaxID=1348613 RepID=A0A8J8MHV1_9FIRM|nr:hypothetical protein [Vallitalea pronyensis]QUI21573.1 hypothetical protein HZI73_04375 [Vallitalea pronyensis]